MPDAKRFSGHESSQPQSPDELASAEEDERATLHWMEVLHGADLNDPRSRITVDKAVEALTQCTSQDALCILTDYFYTTPDQMVQRRIMKAVDTIDDDRVLSFLLDAVRDFEQHREMLVAQIIDWFPDERVIEPLFDAIGVMERSRVWHSVVATLARSGDRAIVRRLRSYLTSDDATYRCAGAVAISTLKPPDLAPVMMILLRNDLDSDIRFRAAQALADVQHPEIVDALIEALDDPEYSVRSAARYGLARQGDQRAVEPLRSFIERAAASPMPSAIEIEDAIGSLVALAGPDLIEYYIQLLDYGCFMDLINRLAVPPEHDTDAWRAAHPRVRAVIPKLIEMLETFEGFRYGLIVALTSLRATEAVDAFIGMLDDPPEGSLYQIIYALGIFGDARAVPALTALLGDPDLDFAVIRALRRIGTPEALAAIEEWSSNR